MAITYDLRSGCGNSDGFYQVLSTFTDRLLAEYRQGVDPLIQEYTEYIRSHEIEKLRSTEEYFFDLILLGVLWNEYGHRAQRLSLFRTQLLRALYSLRRKSKTLKPYADKLRGILATLWLTEREDDLHGPVIPGVSELQHLLRWLMAAGDFREEAVRIERLIGFMSTLQPDAFRQYISHIQHLSVQFTLNGLDVFKPYTGDVQRYVRDNEKTRRWQENVIFCARSEIEYIMNVVGSELMNRAFRASFDRSRKKIALLPACMRRDPDRCQAKTGSLEMICTGCDENCNVYRYRELGKKEGFGVRVIPHSTHFSRWLEQWAAGKNYGIIGVACPLHLISGGLELRKLDIPAQCVFLDYCGCKKHWHRDGIMTDLNGNQLRRITRSRAGHEAA